MPAPDPKDFIEHYQSNYAGTETQVVSVRMPTMLIADINHLVHAKRSETMELRHLDEETTRSTAANEGAALWVLTHQAGALPSQEFRDQRRFQLAMERYKDNAQTLARLTTSPPTREQVPGALATLQRIADTALEDQVALAKVHMDTIRARYGMD